MARKDKYVDTAVAGRVSYKFTSKIMYSGKRNLAEAILREALAPAGQEVRLALAELGKDAGLVGAALVGREALDG